MKNRFIPTELDSNPPPHPFFEKCFLLSPDEYRPKPRMLRGKKPSVYYYGNQDSVFNEEDILDFIKKIFNKRRFSVQIFPTKQTSSEKVSEENLPLELFKQGKISSGKMAELLGLRYDELLEKLITRRIPLNFGPSNLEEAEKEIAVLRKYKK